MTPCRRFRPGVAVAALLLAVAAAGCSRPTAGVVARIDGLDVTVEDVDAYLAANLDDEWGEDALDAAELDLVRSRLFDAFLEERLLLHEADVLGIGATDAEVDAFLAEDRGPDELPGAAERDDAPAVPSPSPGDDPRRRDAAVRTLRIQKLIDRSAHPAAEVGDAEVDAWLRQLGGGRAASSGSVFLRSLLLPSREVADRVAEEIRRRRMTFDEAVARYESTPGQADAVETSLDDLPADVRDAVEPLAGGRVSPPIELHGEIYLFLVVGRGAAGDEDVEAARTRARRELQEHRYLQASRRLLDDLRERVRVEVFEAQLPFRYVPDEGAAGS